jgi:hypothetical membrane protein
MVGRSLETFGTVSGLLAAAAFFILYTTAVLLDPSFIFGVSYLSELGVGPGAWAFNGALILSGLLLLPFTLLDLRALGSSRLANACRVALFATGIAIIGVGVWTMDTLILHTIAALVAFLLLAVSQGLFLAVIARTRAFGRGGTWVTALVFALTLLLLVSAVDPLWETAGVLGTFAWLVLIASMQLLVSTSRPE